MTTNSDKCQEDAKRPELPKQFESKTEIVPNDSTNETKTDSTKREWRDIGNLSLVYDGSTDTFCGENISHVIYLWTEMRDGEEYPCYVGQTRNLIRCRIRDHFVQFQTNLFQRKLRKNKKNFKCYIIDVWEDSPKETESRYILSFNTFHDDNVNGYNLTIGGESSCMSNTVKDKISKKLQGRVFREDTIKKMSESHIGKSPANKGKSPSEKTRQIWSKQRLGRKHTLETKRRMMLSAHRGEEHHMFGKSHSQESLKKMSNNIPVGSSGIRGVREKILKNGSISYRVQQRFNGTMVYLGSYDNKEEAMSVLKTFREKHKLYE